MKLLKSILLTGGASVALAAAAHAADLPTNKPAPPAPPPTLAACASVQDFFVTACPLTYHGITLYGTIDVGGAYQTTGTPFNGTAPFGLEYLVQKNSNHSQFALAPGPLSQSNIGVKVKEDFAPGWSFVGLVETGFDPYSLQLANGPGSMVQNNLTPLANQSTNGDSARAGQIFNSQAFAGVSNTTYGTLTAGRQNSLSLDGVNAYDPMGGSYAFSPIGYSGATAGVGDTEDTRYNTALKYRVNVGQFRAAALYQFGGYAQGNASNGAYQLQLGGDFYGFSLDAIYSYVTDAVALGTYNGPVPFGASIDTLKMVISNDSSVMLLAKYTWNQFKFFGGYEQILFENPSDNFDATAHASGATLTVLGGTPGIVQPYAYTINRTLQIYWTGAKYSITPDLDVTGAYYHYHQLNFSGGHCVGASKGSCDGTLDAVSAMVDWRFGKKFDAYAGVMFSQVSNGLANGYLQRTSADPTIGVRFRF